MGLDRVELDEGGPHARRRPQRPHDFQLTERPAPEPGPGEVLLRIEATTLCGTDLRLITGAKTAGVRPGVVLGHEVAGRIEAVGDGVDGLPVGAQATVPIVVSCHRCRQRLAGREHFCEDLELVGYGIDGGLAEYLLMPARAVAGGTSSSPRRGAAPHPVPGRAAELRAQRRPPVQHPAR